MPSSSRSPRILFFSINGNGLGHLSRCLAYARRMRGRARPVFFSLASAIEIIHDMGFEADYFVSNGWSCSHIIAWNRELAIRVGLMLEEVRPDVLVFDGTWPFDGLLRACERWGVPRKVWSNRGLHKEGVIDVPVDASEFDMVIEPGEIGTAFSVAQAEPPGRKVVVPPVTLLDDDELLGRDDARTALGLERDGRYVLLSLGPGNIKDVSEIGPELIAELRGHGYTVVWTRAPISMRDVPLPEDVIPLSVYPLVRYMRAFDLFVGAAGYNTCCEVLQSRIPGLLVPNTQVIDDQTRRAGIVAKHAPVVVSPCETAEQRAEAVSGLLTLAAERPQRPATADLSGANRAADAILTLVEREVAM